MCTMYHCIIVLCGDFNSRIGRPTEADFIQDDDDLPNRVVIDEISNMHGTAFCDFLLENRLAVVNSCLCPQKDNFTCISTK